MHPVTRKCPCCGSAFTTDNLKRKYCSDTCRNTHQMRKKRARSKARKARIETSAAREALEGKTHLSISEAAKFLGVSRPTLYARIEQGELTPLRVSTRTVRIPIEQLETSTQMQPRPTKGDFSSLISKADVLSKYDISERWLYKCLKEEGIRPKLIKGVSFLPKPDIERMFKPKPVYNPDEWIDAEDLINKEGLARKYISDFARRKAIPCRRIGRTLLVSKKEWEKAHIFQGDRDKNYLTVDQAKKHYHIGQQTFYDKTNEAGVDGIRQGNRVYYRIVDLDRLFKDKTPKIPAEIRKNYMRSGDALKYYHLGQKRFSEETQAAGVTKVRTEGNYVWYKKDELDKLFKKISDNGSN